jgi:hypothetical protein
MPQTVAYPRFPIWEYWKVPPPVLMLTSDFPNRSSVFDGHPNYAPFKVLPPPELPPDLESKDKKGVF